MFSTLSKTGHGISYLKQVSFWKIIFNFKELFRTNDLLFTCKALVKAKRISVLDDRLVYYRIEHESHCQNTNHEHPFDFIMQ